MKRIFYPYFQKGPSQVINGSYLCNYPRIVEIVRYSHFGNGKTKVTNNKFYFEKEKCLKRELEDSIWEYKYEQGALRTFTRIGKNENEVREYMYNRNGNIEQEETYRIKNNEKWF